MEDTLRLNLNAEDIQEIPDTAEYARFWRRAAARLIDAAVHWLLGFIAAFGTAVYFVVMERLTGNSSAVSLRNMRRMTFTGLALVLLAYILYGAISEGLHGSTLGKRLLGMVVLREDKTPCGILAGAGRWIAFLVDSILFGIVGYYAMGTNKREQRYGDQWFRTVVVKRRSVPQAVLRSDVRFVFVFILAVLAEIVTMVISYRIKAAG